MRVAILDVGRGSVVVVLLVVICRDGTRLVQVVKFVIRREEDVVEDRSGVVRFCVTFMDGWTEMMVVAIGTLIKELP